MGLILGAILVAVLIAVGVVGLRRHNAPKPKTEPPRPAPRRVATDTGVVHEAPRAPEPVISAPLPPGFEGFELVTVTQLAPERRTELLGALSRITLPPRSLNELMSPEFMASGSARELAEFIMREPVLAAKVLGRVNSPFYGLQSPIMSVQHAITFLGMNAVRNMALKFMIEDAFHSDNPALESLYRRIWDAGLIASELCVLISQKLGFTDTGVPSTQTVLSFLGEFALLTLLPEDIAIASWQYPLLERTKIQQQALGINAAVAGSLLLHEWGLPAAIADGVDEIGTMLVRSPSTQDLRSVRLGLCYACARTGEGIALGRITDPMQCLPDVAIPATPELHFAQLGLARPEFARFAEITQAPDTRAVLERMIGTVGAPVAAPASA